MKIFKNREAAGELLANRLKNYKADLVLGIPRGGVVVAATVARLLKLPLDIVVTRKIGAPGQEELALGAVDPDGEVVWDRELLKQLKFTITNLQFTIKKAKEEIKRREEAYRHGKKSPDLKNKAVILVDDGVATGATVLSAVKYLKKHGAGVIVAVPVVSKEAAEKIKAECREMLVLEIPEYFQAVGQFYSQFESVTDEEVVQLLNGRRILKSS